MHFSSFGQKFLGDCGILQLMADLGEGAKRPDAIMLGGGNPSRIPEVEARFRASMEQMLSSNGDFERLVGTYDAPGGNRAFVDALADLLRRECGWAVGPENIALTNGSQTAFFFLFNLFAGNFADCPPKKILLPLAPEYIGYGDAGIAVGTFVSYKPQIELLDNRLFKYHVDFDALDLSSDIGAICVSRPTNPTGNVLTEDEIAQLSALAQAHDIPLIVDNAYGAPFPNIIFTETTPRWSPHVVMCMSLSKLGLPGARTGIVVAHEQVIQAMQGMNAVISLAPGALGATLALEMVRSGEVLALGNEVIRPHYAARAERAVALLHESLAGTNYRIHKPEGAFFLWLWFAGMPISSQELYERLKARGVLVVPGQYFFPGLTEDDWAHRRECIRMNYAADEEMLARGVEIIGEEVRRAYVERSAASPCLTDEPS